MTRSGVRSRDASRKHVHREGGVADMRMHSEGGRDS